MTVSSHAADRSRKAPAEWRRRYGSEDKASKDFREARANGRVLSSQVVKEFT